MKYLFIFAIAFCVVTSSFASEDVAPEDEAVVTLTTENFDKFIEDNEITLVEFYAPWCGHCKRLAAEYEAAAKQLKESGGIPLAKVDATKEEELAKKFDVTGYPTLKLFRNGKPEEYKGGRTTATIISWIENMTGPSVEIVDNKAAAEKLVKDLDVAFVGSFVSKDSAAFKTFQEVADANRLFGRYVCFLDSSAKGEVSVHRKDEGAAGTHSVDKKEAFEKFCQQERFPFFGPINGDNYGDYFGSGLDLVWFAGSEKDYESNAETIRKVAKKFRSANSFVWLDAEKFKDHAQSSLGIKEFPSLVLQTKEGRYVYPENTFADAATVITFLKDVAANKIEKFLMSEPIPETNDEPVKVIVGKTFKDMVIQADKDVLVEVYAPWCGHCKKFEPIYTEFAEKMSGNKHLLVAKMDGTSNESPVPNFEWKG